MKLQRLSVGLKHPHVLARTGRGNQGPATVLWREPLRGEPWVSPLREPRPQDSTALLGAVGDITLTETTNRTRIRWVWGDAGIAQPRTQRARHSAATMMVAASEAE